MRHIDGTLAKLHFLESVDAQQRAADTRRFKAASLRAAKRSATIITVSAVPLAKATLFLIVFGSTFGIFIGLLVAVMRIQASIDWIQDMFQRFVDIFTRN